MKDIWGRIAHLFEYYLGIPAYSLDELAGTIIVVTLFILFRWVAITVIRKRIHDVSRQYISIKTSNYILGFIGIWAIIRIWFGGFAGSAAYFGLLSAGLAIALQVPLSNLAGWVFITTRKPFVVGDRIEVNGIAGDVIDIRLLQFTIVEIGNWVKSDQSTGRIIHIPNGVVFKDNIANYNQGFDFIWNELPITVTFESNWEKAKSILQDIADQHTVIKSKDAERQIARAAKEFLILYQHLTPIVWTEISDDGVVLTIRYLCNPRHRRSSAAAILEDVLCAFSDEDDIDFAYRTTRIYSNSIEGPLSRLRKDN